MSDLKKHFIQLMEDVDMGYQAPFDANSGQGITKFAPTPANKVLKSYSVDGDFLRKAIGYGGVPTQAVDQIMSALDGQQADGPLGGSHFDTVMSGFGVPLAGAPAPLIGGVVPPMGSGGPGMEPGAMPPVDTVAPVDDISVDVDPNASDISAGEPSVPGTPVDGEVAAGDTSDMDSGVSQGDPLAPEEAGEAPEGVETTDDVEGEESEEGETGEEDELAPPQENV